MSCRFSVNCLAFCNYTVIYCFLSNVSRFHSHSTKAFRLMEMPDSDLASFFTAQLTQFQTREVQFFQDKTELL